MLCVKQVRIIFYFGLYLIVFGMDTEIYVQAPLNLRIKRQYIKYNADKSYCLDVLYGVCIFEIILLLERLLPLLIQKNYQFFH